MMQEIYFASCEPIQLIKVGIARNATQRIRQLGVDVGHPLDLIGLIEGDRYTEQSIHNTLRQFRHEGEWYYDQPAVRATIQNCFNNFKQIAPSPVTRYTAFKTVCRALWPEKTAEKLSELSGCSPRTTVRWLSGEHDPPAIIIAAIINEITRK